MNASAGKRVFSVLDIMMTQRVKSVDDTYIHSFSKSEIRKQRTSLRTVLCCCFGDLGLIYNAMQAA